MTTFDPYTYQGPCPSRVEEFIELRGHFGEGFTERQDMIFKKVYETVCLTHLNTIFQRLRRMMIFVDNDPKQTEDKVLFEFACVHAQGLSNNAIFTKYQLKLIADEKSSIQLVTSGDSSELDVNDPLSFMEDLIGNMCNTVYQSTYIDLVTELLENLKVFIDELIETKER